MKDLKPFDHPNMENFLCPICRTQADAPVWLVPKRAPDEDGLVECEQVHVECYDLCIKMKGLEDAE